MLSFILSALVLGPVVFYLILYLKNTVRYFNLLLKLPSPKTVSILGDYKLISIDFVTLFKNIRQYAKDLKSVYCLHVLNIFHVVIIRPEDVQLVVSMKTKSNVYKFFRKWLGNGLLTSSGSLWKSHRKMLTPAFHFDILRNFVSSFNKEAEKLVDIFTENEGSPINVLPPLSQFTMSVIVETAMGCKLSVGKENDVKYMQSIKTLNDLISERIRDPLAHFNSIYYLFTKNGRHEKQLLKIINDYTINIIKKKESEMDIAQYGSNGKKKFAMLDLLLKMKRAGGDIDDVGIIDEVNTILFGGYHTTSHALSYILMLLAQHKEIQERVYEELMDNLEENQIYFDMNILGNLKYMERVIKEGLRLYPSANTIGKCTDKDIHTNDGYIIPKGSSAILMIYDIHRDEKHWPEPEKFDPDRFLPENSVKRHPFAYLPFSAGPRNCIGQKYALLEIKVVLCTVLKNFILEPVHTQETLVFTFNTLLTTKNDSVLVKFIRRK